MYQAPAVGQKRLFYSFYTDMFKGRTYEIVEATIESVSTCASGTICGMAKIEGSGGFDWYEYPDGTLCHGRRHAPIETPAAESTDAR